MTVAFHGDFLFVSQAASLVDALRAGRACCSRALCLVRPVLAPPGFVWLAVSLRRRPGHGLTLLGVALLLARSSRLLTLGVLSATAIRLPFRYVLPTAPLVLLLGALPLAHSLGRRSISGFSTPRQVSSGTSRMSSTATPMQAARPQLARWAPTVSRIVRWVM